MKKNIAITVSIIAVLIVSIWIERQFNARNNRISIFLRNAIEAVKPGPIANPEQKPKEETPVKKGEPTPGPIESPVNGSETVKISVGQPYAYPLLHGFLLGVTYKADGDYSRAVSYARSLNAKTWRLANVNNVYEFIVDEARLPSRQGTKITYVVQDVFHSAYGQYIKINPQCPTDRKNCFRSYSDFKTAWTNTVEKFMQTAVSRDMVIDYYDVFAEPTTGHTKLDGLSGGQLAEVFKITHDIIRKYKPDAKIVAPGFATYDAVQLKAFLAYVISQNLRLDALSWHELGRSEMVPERVKDMKDYIAANPKLCSPSCPEIHINEYGGPKAHLVPGEALLWLYYLEKAGVNQANKACWDVEDPAGVWSDCWTGLEGLLLSDNMTPQPMYWVYERYGMLGSRIKTETKNARAAAIAGVDRQKEEIRILAGKFKYDGTGISEDLKLAVTEYPFAAKSVRVEISKIANTRNLPVAMPAMGVTSAFSIRLTGDSFAVPIDRFGDGDAYYIVIKPE